MQRSTTSRQSNGRRSYNRTSTNSFKFHNFVFNEANQSLCLEEQHGNKKITVLHWKKSDDKQRQSESKPVKSSLVKSGKICKMNELLASNPSSIVSSQSFTSNKRRNTAGLASSASFPLTYNNEQALLSVQPKPEELSPSVSCCSSVLHASSSSLLSASSSQNKKLDNLYSQSNEELISRSNHSSSSIATTSSSSSVGVVHQSQISLNRSLCNLDLTENTSRSSNRRKPSQVRRIISHVDSDSNISLHTEDNPDGFDISILDSQTTNRQHETIDEKDYLNQVQTQPLDLSTKSTRDRNNNESDKKSKLAEESHRFISKDEDETLSTCESVESFNSSRFGQLFNSDNYLNMPSSSWMGLGDPFKTNSSLRSECLSPSEMISSVKCCSPSLSSCSKDRIPPNPQNPFMLPEISSRSKSYNQSANSQLPNQSFPEMFDSFLEEEIHKMLQSNRSPQQSNTSSQDINECIEDKLRMLQQDILNMREAQSNFSTSESDFNETPLKLHFKLDSNKNLEPYGGSELGKIKSPFLTSMEEQMPRSRINQRNQIKRQLEDTFKQNGFLVKTKQVSDANNSAMFCKFRQLRKYTRYYLKSWQNHLPEEVNKLWKGFLPPKTERPLYLNSNSVFMAETSPSNFPSSIP